jgi:hypothetical protein
MADRQEPRPRRRLRRLSFTLLILAVGGLVLLVMAPTLVSLGLGHGLVRDALQARVNGTVDFSELSVGWRGPQRMTGLSVTDATGREAALLDVTIDRGLLALVRGPDSVEVTVAGALVGDLHGDGSTSFTTLLADGDADEDDAADETPDEPGPPVSLAGLPAAVIELDELDLTLYETATGRTIRGALSGGLTYVPGGVLDGTLHAATRVGGTDGLLHVSAVAQRLFDEDGVMRPSGARLDVTVTGESLPIPSPDVPGELIALSLTATAGDLTKRLDVEFEAVTRLADHEPSDLRGVLTADAPLSPDGEVRVGLDTLTFGVSGTRVPTALVDPVLAALPVRASRDVGPVVDINANLAPTEDGTKELLVSLQGEHLRAEVTGPVDESQRVFRGRTVSVEGRVHPDLADALAGVTLSDAAYVTASFEDLVVPLREEGGGLDLGRLAGRGDVEMQSPVTVTLPGETPRTLDVGATSLRLETAGLADGVQVAGRTSVNGAAVELDERITNLLDADGGLAPADAVAVGTLAVRGLPGATVAAFLDEPPAAAAALLDDTFDIEVVTDVPADGDGDLEARLALTGQKTTVAAEAVRAAEGVHVRAAWAEVPLTAELARALQAGRETPVVPATDTTVTVQVSPFTLPGRLAEGLAAPETVVAAITVGDTALENVPSTVEPVGLAGLAATLTASLADGRYRLAGDATVRRPGDGSDVGTAEYDLTVAPDAERTVQAGRVVLRDVRIAALEQLAGREPGTWSAWVGTRGTVTAEMTDASDGWGATIESDLPNLAGRFAATADGERLSVAAEPSTLTLRRPVLQRLVNPPPPDPSAAATADAPPRMTIDQDLPLALDVRELRLPLAMLGGEAFDPAAVDLDVELAGGPFAFTDDLGARTAFERLRIALTSDDLRDGVRLVVAGRTDEAADDAGVIDIDGRLTGLVSDDARLDPSGATLALDAKARRVPTATLDAIGRLDGMLVAAVGTQTNLDLTADAFSANGGRLDARVDTTNGWLQAAVTGHDGAYHISEAEPLQAELAITSELGQRVLAKIQPILADIRTKGNPVRATVRNVLLPADRDVSRLNADLELTIGEVEFDSGSLMLSLLKLARSGKDRSTLEGYVEPIVARIRNGIVTYDRFAVRIDKYTLAYTGQVDLNTQQVDLRTEIPLEGLALSIRELRGVEGLSIPVVTRGTFGALKTEVDPDFDLGRFAVEAGIQGLLNEALGGRGTDAGQVADDGGGTSGDGGKAAAGGLLGGLLGGALGKDDDDDDDAGGQPAPVKPGAGDDEPKAGGGADEPEAKGGGDLTAEEKAEKRRKRKKRKKRREKKKEGEGEPVEEEPAEEEPAEEPTEEPAGEPEPPETSGG